MDERNSPDHPGLERGNQDTSDGHHSGGMPGSGDVSIGAQVHSGNLSGIQGMGELSVSDQTYRSGLQGMQGMGDLRVMASRAMMSDRVIPTRFIADYTGLQTVPLMTNKILTGTMIMADPNTMTQMTMFGDYKLQGKALLPESMMHVRPMYGDMKAIQGRAFVGEQMYPLRSIMTDAMMVPSVMAAPRQLPQKNSTSVNTDMMTGITMISGKPLSGRVMVGDARAVTTRNTTSDKTSPVKTINNDRMATSRGVVADGKASSGLKGNNLSLPPKPPTPAEKPHTPSKLSQIDKMTAARISSGERPNSAKPAIEKRWTLNEKVINKGSLSENKIYRSGKLSPTKSESLENNPLFKNSPIERPSSTKSATMFGDKSASFPKSIQSDRPMTPSRNNSLERKVATSKKNSPTRDNITPRDIPGGNHAVLQTSPGRTILGDSKTFCVNNSVNVNRVTLNNNVSVNNSSISVNNNKDKHAVHWFRRGLRLHDNPALREAIAGCTTFRCIYILDPWFAGSSNVGVNKWRFLLQCLTDLDNSLRNLNSRLFVVRGQPANALPQLFKEWSTNVLTFEEDPEPFGKARDASIIAIAQEMDIQTIVRTSHTLYSLDKIIEKKGGKPPLTYRTFQNILTMIDPPPPPAPPVEAANLAQACTPVQEDHDDKYGVPNLEDLGFETDHLPPAVWKGGETEALSRLKHHLERKAWVASFDRPKMTPQSLFACPTGLSPYLRFGCLSARKFYTELNELYRKIKKVPAPVSLHGQLLWREFFYTAATNNPKFDHMKGNPICVQIPWDKNPEALAKWAHGQTGFPWIDAIMTQLRNEGWIHNVARHAVACFLTRGDLWVSWEEGMKVFDELLLDADWSVNAGSWMWLSCSSFFQQFFHCYCPVRYGRKADPNGDYIRTYLPVLKNFPTKYIHEPWLASEAVQRNARCLIGQHYPLPMVDHATQSQNNIERMKQVYQQLAHYRGNQVSRSSPSPRSCSEFEKQRRHKGSGVPSGPPRNLHRGRALATT